MAKRLSEKEKEVIAQSFKDGKSIEVLSKDFNCNKLTIIRNLKKNLGEAKYKELINNKKLNTKNNQNNKNSIKKSYEFEKNDKSKKDFSDKKNSNINQYRADFEPVDSFLEIAPIDYAIDNSSRKELSSVHISEVDFPKVVYMVVDKKIELETKLLKDFPSWDFLPDDDLNRKTIEIFFDLNLEKRSCNKDQKVLKIPNTEVFRIASPVLIAKGISRIVCA
ncbi:MAG: hypothetical protein CMA12_00800, partial [Euryarchaeota archaeon]